MALGAGDVAFPGGGESDDLRWIAFEQRHPVLLVVAKSNGHTAVLRPTDLSVLASCIGMAHENLNKRPASAVIIVRLSLLIIKGRAGCRYRCACPAAGVEAGGKGRQALRSMI